MASFDRGGRGSNDGGRGRGGGRDGGGRGGGGGGRDFGGRGGGRDGGGGGGGRDGGGRGGGGRDFGGRDGGGRGGGGRDFGGRDGGGRGGGGGGGRGGNAHMGTQGAVLALLNKPEMSDAAILAVINPPLKDRDRNGFVRSAGYSVTLPKPHQFRESRIGAAVPESLTIRTNHFLLNTAKIPHTITHYHVHLYKVRNGVDCSEDIAADEDLRNTFVIMRRLRERHPEWDVNTAAQSGRTLGFAYDGRSALFTSYPLSLRKNEKNEPYLSEIIGLSKADGSESETRVYRIALTFITTVLIPPNTADATWKQLDQTVIRALDLVIFNFARVQLGLVDDVTFNVQGNNIFSATKAFSFPVSSILEAKQGWFASIRSYKAGLVLCSDLAVNCFLATGDMPELMFKAAQLRDFNDLINYCRQRTGLPQNLIDLINKAISNLKVRLVHIGHSKKVKKLGPAANSPASEFDMDGTKITVSAYFEMMAKKDPVYRNALGKNGKLKYPELPTINVGSTNKPILVPAELVAIPSGQSRNQYFTPEVTGKMVRYAAVKPHERMSHINNEGSVITMLKTDPSAIAFGLNDMNPTPMKVPATLLPPPRLQYGKNATIDPVLNGTWNIDYPKRNEFLRAPPFPQGNAGYTYGVLVVGDGPPRDPQWKEKITGYTENLEKVAFHSGVKLSRGGDFLTSTDRHDQLKAQLSKMKGARIVLVVMFSPSYGDIKKVADSMGILTSCIKWETLDKNPRSLCDNIMLKVNTKMGGLNHSLKSRLPAGSAPSAGSFQKPPASLSWLLDKPCMFLGIDVSHPESGADRPSMAAVVGSLDGSLGQYAVHISSQTSRVEMVAALTDAVRSLMHSFKARNQGKFPETMIVYRDGVSESQYDQVLENELPSIRNAFELEGLYADSIKLAIIICTKRHKARVVFEDDTGTYINPCPGLVVDNSIVSNDLIEFYLNSHAAIQGTCKPAKYTLIHDEIGFKVAELQLMTYWTCYLYARANKAVSYAAPAYYAHWASKRAKDLAAAGATAQDLIDISALWSRGDCSNPMFFI